MQQILEFPRRQPPTMNTDNSLEEAMRAQIALETDRLINQGLPPQGDDKEYVDRLVGRVTEGLLPKVLTRNAWANQAETRLSWTQTAHGMLDVYVAECGPYDFEICTTPNMGYQLRMWQLQPGDSPLRLWERDGYSLQEAQARAECLAAQHVPVISK
jgi:hypothetical protein